MSAAPMSSRRNTWQGSESISIGEMLTPVGPLVLVAGPEGVLRIELPNGNARAPMAVRAGAGPRNELPIVAADARIDAIKDQLREYFEGKRKTFDLPLSPMGPTSIARCGRPSRGFPTARS